MKSLVEYMKSVENKKRSLEESVDKLNEEIARLKSDGSSPDNTFVYDQQTTNEVSTKFVLNCLKKLLFNDCSCTWNGYISNCIKC